MPENNDNFDKYTPFFPHLPLNFFYKNVTHKKK